MKHTKTEALVDEAQQTVEGLLQHYDVPGQVRREVEPLCDDGNYLDALDVLVKNR